MRKLVAVLMAAAVATCAGSVQPLAAQIAPPDSVVCRLCVVDTITTKPDSARDSIVVTVDTLYRHFVRTDTTFRDSTVPVVPPPLPTPPPTVGLDTTGMRPLMHAEFLYRNDRGSGIVPFTATWSGNMLVLQGNPFATYLYPVGMRAGASPGSVWNQEPDLANQRTADGYLSVSYRYSVGWSNPTNPAGSLVNSKTMLLGFGHNGNQFILSMIGTGAWGFAWQGLGTLPPLNASGVPVGTIYSPDPVNGNVGVRSQRGVRRGTFQHIELRWHSGLPGTRSSYMKLWVDGVLACQMQAFDIVRPGASPVLYYNKLAPVYGGLGSPVVSPQALDIANMDLYGN